MDYKDKSYKLLILKQKDDFKPSIDEAVPTFSPRAMLHYLIDHSHKQHGKTVVRVKINELSHAFKSTDTAKYSLDVLEGGKYIKMPTALRKHIFITKAEFDKATN